VLLEALPVRKPFLNPKFYRLDTILFCHVESAYRCKGW